MEPKSGIHFSIVSVFPMLSAFKGFSECVVTAELPLRMAQLNLPTANISRTWANQARLKNIHLLFGTVFFNSSWCTTLSLLFV